MFELSEEKTLMNSSDNSVRLTTHRIIYDSGKSSKQIMLEDFESYHLVSNPIGAYGVLLSIFIGLAILIILNKISNCLDYNLSGSFFNCMIKSFRYDTGFVILLFILMVFHFFYLISRRYYIKIIGKYNSIEFRVKSFKNPSIRRMLETLVKQSNQIKAIKKR